MAAATEKEVADLEKKCTLNIAKLPIDFLAYAALVGINKERACNYGIMVFQCPCSNCRKAAGIFERIKKSE